jgi:hypothetical protein
MTFWLGLQQARQLGQLVWHQQLVQWQLSLALRVRQPQRGQDLHRAAWPQAASFACHWI